MFEGGGQPLVVAGGEDPRAVRAAAVFAPLLAVADRPVFFGFADRRDAAAAFESAEMTGDQGEGFGCEGGSGGMDCPFEGGEETVSLRSVMSEDPTLVLAVDVHECF